MASFQVSCQLDSLHRPSQCCILQLEASTFFGCHLLVSICMIPCLSFNFYCIMIEVTIVFIPCSSKHILCFVYHVFNQCSYTDASYQLWCSFDFIFPAVGAVVGEVWVVCLPVVDSHSSRNISALV